MTEAGKMGDEGLNTLVWSLSALVGICQRRVVTQLQGHGGDGVTLDWCGPLDCRISNSILIPLSRTFFRTRSFGPS